MALKIGLVGLPRATAFATAFRAQADVEIWAGCDTDQKRLREYGDRRAWWAAQELHRCLLPLCKKTS